MRREDLLCAELHDGRRNSFGFHETTLDVEWKGEGLLTKFGPLFLGPSDFGLSSDGENNSVQVHAIENEQAWESSKNIATTSAPEYSSIDEPTVDKFHRR
jgi:hypothetical protein